MSVDWTKPIQVTYTYNPACDPDPPARARVLGKFQSEKNAEQYVIAYRPFPDAEIIIFAYPDGTVTKTPTIRVENVPPPKQYKWYNVHEDSLGRLSIGVGYASKNTAEMGASRTYGHRVGCIKIELRREFDTE